MAPPAPPATSGVTAGPPPAGYEPASRFGLPAFMPGLGALYVRPQTLPVGPYLAYDRDDRLVSTVYMVPIADLVARKKSRTSPSPTATCRTLTYYSPGHPGVVVPHYHFVLWYVPKAAANCSSADALCRQGDQTSSRLGAELRADLAQPPPDRVVLCCAIAWRRRAGPGRTL